MEDELDKISKLMWIVNIEPEIKNTHSEKFIAFWWKQKAGYVYLRNNKAVVEWNNNKYSWKAFIASVRFNF